MPPPRWQAPLQAVGGDVHSWGSGEMGQLGFPLLEDLPKDQDGYPYEPTAGLIKAFSRMKICQIAGGDGHTAAVTVHGKLYSWGASACGQLGHSDTEHMPKDVEGYPYQPVPLLVGVLQDTFIVQIACGDAHTVALSREGVLFSWGGGGCGQLGHSETSKMPKDEDGCPYQLTPRVVEHLRPHVVSTIACGKAHTIAVSDRGRMFTWGAGACGQLGHPDTSSFPSDEDGYPFQPVPREVEQLTEHRVIATACGDVHTLALTDLGHVYSFGGGSYGQLGVKDVGAMPVDADNCPYMPTPQRVSGLEGIIRLACGDSHSLTVDRDGRLFCWGANSCGQLGILNPEDPRIRKDPDGIPHLPTPAVLDALADQRIVDIACGEAHSLAVSAMGNLYSWGACSCGQLGLGSCEGMPVDSDGYPYQPTPTLVTAGFQGKAVFKVACGGVHNLAVTEPDQSLAHSLATLVNTDMLADVCFRSSEGELLYAHSCIFKINAPPLYNFVQAQIEQHAAAAAAGAPEAAGREVPEISMSHVRMEVLVDFVHFVYTLDVDAAAMSLSSFAAVLELYHLGAKFHLGALLPKCRRIIRQQLGRQNIHRPWLPNVLATGASSSADIADPSAVDLRSDTSAPSSSPLGHDDVPAPLSSGGFGGSWPASDDGWGIFFLPGGQALVLDGAAYRDTLRRGTLLDLLDADLPSPEEGSTVLEERMRALLADESSADVRLTVRGDNGSELELSAHKCILACRSAYFRALFSSEFRERSASRLPLEDITPDQLLLLLNFIYTDDWLVEDADFALDMIPIADRFSVLDLKRLCERTLICTMGVDNVARIFALADRYACSRLRGRALLFMTDSNNFHSVLRTEGFAELDKGLILEILHSHRITPAPAPPPLEPLPGNSATAAKAGQSKLRDHRHARGGGGGGGSAPTARPTQSSSSTSGAATSTSEHGGRGSSSSSGGAGAGAGAAASGSASSSSAAAAGGGAGSSTSRSAHDVPHASSAVPPPAAASAVAVVAVSSGCLAVPPSALQPAVPQQAEPPSGSGGGPGGSGGGGAGPAAGVAYVATSSPSGGGGFGERSAAEPRGDPLLAASSSAATAADAAAAGGELPGSSTRLRVGACVAPAGVAAPPIGLAVEAPRPASPGANTMVP
mmetsp:Transcript_10926/g.38382  ORF Transcript_10926/g.38382 Transcript_10926/m.38382 type:complete len:1143 (-) Transcript_10926:44-3472(-)